MADDTTPPGRQRRRVDDAEIEAAVPRETGGREVWVGLFVILGILSAIAVLFVLTDPASLRGRYMVVTTLDNAGGIRRHDPVLMRGVNIGRINNFEMVGGRVNIILEIEGEWELPDDSFTRLAGAGIFGGRTMEVIPGLSLTPLQEWDTIPSAGEDGGILGTAEEMGGQATLLIERLNQMFSDPTIAAVQGTASEIHALTSELRRVVGAQQAQLAELQASLRRSAAAIESAAEASPDVARVAARADTAMAQITLTTRTLDRTASLLDSILSRIEAGEGSLGRFARDDSLYVNVNRAAESIAALATDIRENPGRYLRIRFF